jgi:molybdenum cofactor cytidylyltransferase
VIGGLVLAAGGGRRFGAQKLLAELEGRPLVEHAVQAMLAAPVDRTVVVLGSEAGVVRERAELDGAETVVCERWREGQAASLRAGLEALEGAEAIVVTLGDQPRVSPLAIERVLGSRGGGALAVRATYGGVASHPTLLEAPLLPRLRELRGDVGARAILAGIEVREVPCDGLGSPIDVDTTDDLEVARAPDPVVGIVLGAGSSRRLGRPKQTLPLGETNLLGWIMRDVEASSLDRVVLVLGGAAEEARAGLALRRATIAYNRSYGTGCASSLLAGLDAAGSCDAVMLLLGDMPGVDPSVINAVLTDWKKHRPWAAVTRYEDAVGHPLLFAATAFPALRALHGDKAVWKLIAEVPERVREVPVTRTLPGDVNTWADYEVACRRLGVEPRPTPAPR